jgi:MtN3 and saliva related transmembrane protein
MNKDLVGYAAGICTTGAFIPQVYQVYKKHSAKGLSMLTLIIFFFGQILWLIYGFLKNDKAVLMPSIISTVLYIYLLYAKVLYN